MNATFARLMPVALMTASSLTVASGHLTPQECNSYPLKPAQGVLSRADLARELAELGSVGYRPGLDNYSLDINDARDRLKAEYARDCLPAQSTAGTPSSGG